MKYKHVRATCSGQYNFDGGVLTSILATSVHADRRVSIFDTKFPAGHESPWYCHEIDDETFYIISGELQFGVDTENFTASSGDLVIAGPSVQRRFKALKDSHILVINTPSIQ